MKTTSYEISKQLTEAGFKAETEFFWAKWNEGEPELAHGKEQLPHLIEQVPAYDFETILQVLPRVFELRKVGKVGVIYELRAYFYHAFQHGEYLREEDNYIGYQNFQGFLPKLCFKQEKNESFADAAARLWLGLKKEWSWVVE